MTRLGGINRNMGGSGNAGGVSARHGGVSLKDLPEELQRAWEIVEALKYVNEPQLLAKLFARAAPGASPGLGAAGAFDPPSLGALQSIAKTYEALGMKLDSVGYARFKQERGLVAGTMTGAIARAYVRALDGGEIVVFVTKGEEATLRPSEKACLAFFRELQKKSDASALAAAKRALGLGNPPPLTEGAADLENEYVGVSTVKEIAKATSLKNLPLTKDGLRALAVALADDQRRAAAPKGTKK